MYKNIGLKIQNHCNTPFECKFCKEKNDKKRLITNKTDIWLISETKLDQSFPNQQFQVHGYKMLQRDRDKYVGGMLFHLHENIPSKLLQVNSTLDENEIILLELFTKGLKWLCISVYKAPS